MFNISKIIYYKKSLLILSIVLILFIGLYFFASLDHSKCSKKEVDYGITFSKMKMEDLGLDWGKSYIGILDGLDIKNIRLSAYWNEIEQQRDEFVFDSLDWQINEASKRNINIILAVGGRLPRWPECHFPEWSKNISKQEREGELLDYIKKTIERYKNNKQIKAWQVENEPFLSSRFGECPKIDVSFLDKEIELLRQLDDRQIVITDSGELSLWIPAAKRADIFGTTMYLNTYSSRLKKYVHYPINSGFFYLKRKLAGLFASPEKWIVIELQAEPWGPKPFHELDAKDIEKTMSPEKLDKIVEMARQSGFCELYLWGAEYWYWDRVFNKNEQMWNKAKAIFNN